MLLTTARSRLRGSVRIPASKSHTVRALVFAALATGESEIRDPLQSHDTRSAMAMVEALGARVSRRSGVWRITGFGAAPVARGQVVDVGNSGTSLYIGLGTAALGAGEIVFDGDDQIRRRPAANLLASLRDLGAEARAEGAGGCCPIRVRGPLTGGSTTISCPTSQYLTSLLMCAPFASGDSEIHVPLLYEQPYVEMTLKWLAELGVQIDFDDTFSRFAVPGGQHLKPFCRSMPGDFSSATFFLCAGAITGGEVLLRGLDLEDAQGDKAVVDYLRRMGALISSEEGGLRVRSGGELHGAELDLNETPDALPAMAVTAACARGRTRLVNVPQARLKETDRIAVMAAELTRLGVGVREYEDGLEIDGGRLRGGQVLGHGDHRVVMALALAGLAAEEPVTVSTAEAVAVTFPGFTDLMAKLGAEVRTHD